MIGTQTFSSIADDLEGGSGNFYEFSNTIAHGSAEPLDPDETKYLPDPSQAKKVYLGEICDLHNPDFATECRADIANAINEEGALIVSYVGHAQTRNWAVEKLMDPALVNDLTNGDRLSIFLGMACFEGFFHKAQSTQSLGKSYVLNPNGEAMASWSPTGFGVATGHDWLEQGLFLVLFQEDETVLGAAMSRGKEYLYHNAPPHKYDDLVDTFLLFGDPALQVQASSTPTAIEMAGFEAPVYEGHVLVSWESVKETEILGFNVLRSSEADGEFVQRNAQMIWAEGPGSTSGFRYTYRDSLSADGRGGCQRCRILVPTGDREAE